MSEYIIYTDSSCDLPINLVNQLGIRVMQLDVSIDNGPAIPNNKIDIREFYQMLRDGKNAQTSAVTLDTFKNAFKEVLLEGKDMIYIGFSSGLSSTYNWGKVAAEELSEEFPERKILTVDTLAASLGQGMIVYLAAKKKEEGATVEEVCEYIESIKMNLAHWFTVNDLFFLKRGGRISSATAVVGTMLSIKPVLHVDNAGKLISVSKARGRKAAIAALAQKMKEAAINPKEQTIFISHGDCIDEVNYLCDIIRKEIGVKDIIINYVGPVIGSHAGPGVIALFYLGKER